jgi:hypothetical protein
MIGSPKVYGIEGRQNKQRMLHMTKKTLHWKNIVQLAAGVRLGKMALIVAGIWAGMSSPAWATGTGLYEMHTDGTVWQYQAGEPCKGGVCAGRLQIRGAGNTYAIAAGGGTSLLALVDNDFNFFVYNGKPCVGGNCPGWNQIGTYNTYTGWACPGFYLSKRAFCVGKQRGRL